MNGYRYVAGDTWIRDRVPAGYVPYLVLPILPACAYACLQLSTLPRQARRQVHPCLFKLTRIWNFLDTLDVIV